MRYFDYQQQGTLGRVWSLFAGLGDLTEDEKLGETRYSCAYAHTLEIVNAALSGAISTSKENIETFNLEAYEYKCFENDRISKIKNAERFLYIVDDAEEDEQRVGYGDISERRLKSVEDSFEILESIESFESSLLRLLDIRDCYIKEKGIDLVGTLQASLKGIPDAMSKMQRIISENDKIRDLVVSLCENGKEGVLMKRLEMVM